MKSFLKTIVPAVIFLSSVCSYSEVPPKIDLHVHLTRSSGESPQIRYEKAALLSQKMGVVFGIAEEISNPDPKQYNGILLNLITQIKTFPLYIGLQVNERNWTSLYSKETLAKIDYIMADALIFPDKDGKVRRIWLPDFVPPDPQDFMERYIKHNLLVLSEPINIWVNPTFLPESLQQRYDELWTDKRMKILIDAAVKNNIAIEINSRYKIPSKKFIDMAKKAGAHFTFGSNQHDTHIGEIEWSVAMAEKCGLQKEDFFVPKRKLSIK
jgi:hypothetical protein